ncbi:MAG: glycosyltransferase family 2 protein [Bacteroidia bacterium]|nr:glycosyltransferase family 2 protein [Bacteroidia bacterium]
MLSIVIPIYNEEGLIDDLVKRTVSALEAFIDDYEIIFVEDGSEDQSLQYLLNWQNKNHNIKVLSLSKNFGHQAAFTAGLEYAAGEIVGMMDGDLQDPPELFGEMYRKITEENYDIISGTRSGRKGKSGRNIYTSLFHLLFRNVAVIQNMENTGNFSMMKREAVDALLTMKEKVRYLPGLRSFIGFKQGYVEFVRDERSEGDPKMSLSKLFILAADAIFAFSRFPIKMCLYLGLIGTIVFMFAGIYVLIAKIFGFAVIGWSSTLLSIYFLGSIQLVSLGVVGEYVYRIYKESQNRPIYFVKKFYDGNRAK